LKITQIQTTEEDHRIAKLAAIAILLHMFEAVIPSPLPGVKPGIANIVTLYVLYQYGFATAAWVSILRVFASSLLLGQFLSPTFVLSLSGAMLSLAVLWLAIRHCWTANNCAPMANSSCRGILFNPHFCCRSFVFWVSQWLDYEEINTKNGITLFSCGLF
jgi:hypothetical protein